MFFFLSTVIAYANSIERIRIGGSSMITDTTLVPMGNIEIGMPNVDIGIKSVGWATGFYGHYNVYEFPNTDIRIIGGVIRFAYAPLLFDRDWDYQSGLYLGTAYHMKHVTIRTTAGALFDNRILPIISMECLFHIR